MTKEFTAWELETIFHLASNAARDAGSDFEKLRELASKAINERVEKYPDYLKQYGVTN